MRETLRVHMGWLHSWVGFLAGLLLACVFASGTLAVFDTEITQWMQPEVSLAQGASLTPTALQAAAQAIEAEEDKGLSAFLTLPSQRDPVLRVLHYDGYEFVGTALNSETGAVFQARETAGGQFFYNFHFSLRGGNQPGVQIVTFLGLCMLVAIGSGLVIHIKALWPDLILFRPFGARPRAWVDAHLIAGVLFLPFIAFMGYTGTAIHARVLLPAEPFFRSHMATPHKKEKTAPKGRVLQAGPLPPPLAPLIAQARDILRSPDGNLVLFTPDEVHIFKSDAFGPFLTRDHVDFSRKDGHLLRSVTQSPPAVATMQLVRGLHYARYAPLPLRWLYFLSGLAATALAASGLVVFLMKRRRSSGEQFFFQMAEALTMTTVVGFPTATLGVFWANRCLPTALSGRAMIEIDLFFIVWGLCAAHALLLSLTRHAASGWRQQLGGLAGAGCGLPVLDLASRSHAWGQGASVFMAADALAFLTGLIALCALLKLRDPAA
ncbi:MAG: PepSY-associated TM helix domain-containing protein [Acetobacter malorum]|uniref:PepSY-associated TM helix domain-containing protein n=1 Tax=Acetobacter malorum TaxID=178901 RepID=UPI0039E960D5